MATSLLLCSCKFYVFTPVIDGALKLKYICIFEWHSGDAIYRFKNVDTVKNTVYVYYNIIYEVYDQIKDAPWAHVL